MFTVFYSNSRNCEDHRTEIEEKDAQEEEHREEHKGVDKNYLFTVILMDTHINNSHGGGTIRHVWCIWHICFFCQQRFQIVHWFID